MTYPAAGAVVVVAATVVLVVVGGTVVVVDVVGAGVVGGVRVVGTKRRLAAVVEGGDGATVVRRAGAGFQVAEEVVRAAVGAKRAIRSAGRGPGERLAFAGDDRSDDTRVDRCRVRWVGVVRVDEGVEVVPVVRQQRDGVGDHRRLGMRIVQGPRSSSQFQSP